MPRLEGRPFLRRRPGSARAADRPPAVYGVNVRGVELALHPSPDYVSDWIRAHRDFYEADILDEIARRVTGGTIVDAGAMIGNHSAYLAAFIPGATVQAFEPLPANLALLAENARPYPSITVHPVALLDGTGAAWMTAEAGNLGHAVITATPTPTPVIFRSLDSYGFRDVSLIKIDVEGHEPEVLAGARRTIARWRPLIVLEDWRNEYGALLPGYRVAAEWEAAHQTFLYEPADD